MTHIDLDSLDPSQQFLYDMVKTARAERDAFKAELDELARDSSKDIRELRTQDAEIARLRKLLFFRHGCPTSAMYGDDGEMQCQACFVDFRRMSAEEIEETWSRTALLALAAAAKEPAP